VNRGWAQWRTKESESLDCRFLGKKGQFNLSQLEGLGTPAELNGQRSEGEVLHLTFQRLEQLRLDRLKEILTEHLSGFRAAFGKES
jgi:hypothetical protein